MKKNSETIKMMQELLEEYRKEYEELADGIYKSFLKNEMRAVELYILEQQ